MPANPFILLATPADDAPAPVTTPPGPPFPTFPEPAEALTRAAAPEPAEVPDDPANDPEPTPEVPAELEGPARHLTGWAGARRRRRLTDDEVLEIREAYAYRRALAEQATTAEEWETPHNTERELGALYGMSHTSVKNLVTGRTYPDAPGPIDGGRRERLDRYDHDKAVLGPEAARSRSLTRDGAGAGGAGREHVVITVTRADGTAREFRYGLGTTVTVEVRRDDPPAELGK